jgi:hypothetical protein
VGAGPGLWSWGQEGGRGHWDTEGLSLWAHKWGSGWEPDREVSSENRLGRSTCHGQRVARLGQSPLWAWAWLCGMRPTLVSLSVKWDESSAY